MVYKRSFDVIPKIASIMRQGEVAILPTDTIYGFSGVVSLGTHKKIVALKGRSADKPFIELIAEPGDIYAITDKVPESLVSLWPAALTLIVEDKRQGAINPTVAIRCPANEWLRSLIKEAGVIYSTSVNRSGEKPLLSIDAIINKWATSVKVIVDAGELPKSAPSTIAKVTGSAIEIVRQGAILLPTQIGASS